MGTNLEGNKMLRQPHVVKLHCSCTFLMHAKKTDIYPTIKHRWLFHIMFPQNYKAIDHG